MNKFLLIFLFIISCSPSKDFSQDEFILSMEAGTNIGGSLTGQSELHSWGVAGSVEYLLGVDFVNSRSCLFYKVSDKSDGELYGVMTKDGVDCQNVINDSPVFSIGKIRSMSVKKNNSTFNFYYTLENFKEDQFSFTQKKYIGMEFLINQGSQKQKLADGVVCSHFDVDCNEIVKSNCDSCENAWYEIYNGCKLGGKKICGAITCGSRGNPACLRGITYQRKRVDYKCREDDSFVFCAKGLKINCQGEEAYCL
jgi:hypothetical protein